ncbi:MAG: CatA-like O-acetyltransferase, partial [Eubacteriales bacterium]
ISLCDEIDVTALYDSCKISGHSFYISVLYAVARVVNSHDEFKMTAVDSPKSEFPMPAVYDRVDVTHNIFREESESYSSVFTVYKSDFGEFYSNCLDDIERVKRLNISAVPCGENAFEASCVPWRHFTSVGVSCDSYPLLPIVSWGRFRENAQKKLMPLSIQINHASADGFHLARFLNETEEICSDLAGIIKSASV